MLDVPSEELSRAIFHTLAYSDVFDYPLTATEVWRYLAAERASLDQVRQALTDARVFTQAGEYFTLCSREHIAQTRRRRGEVAARIWPKAARYGRIIALLPFVRMVAVTGSLAVNNTGEDNDVDFFIVTAPGRLWTCRALALLIARIARLEGLRLCPNYLVTTRAMWLEERSHYVARELAQMIPLSGMDVYWEMRRQNAWADEYLPNAVTAPDLPPGAGPVREPFVLQQLLEAIFRLPFARWFEKWEMDRKIMRLSREQSASRESFFSADVCKGHKDHHGQTIVTALAARLDQLSIPPLPLGEGRGEGE